VVEFQARGIIHVHFVARLDGPTGPDTPPQVDLDADDVGAAVLEVAHTQRLQVTPDGPQPVALRWGDQVDVRPITPAAGRDDRSGDAHPEQVAAYLAKYLTKSTEDFGLTTPGKVHSATDARYLGARPHAVRIIETAEHLAATAGPDYIRLADRYGTLGYRGHPITKTRRYSVTFGQLRHARRSWRQRRSGLAPETDVREIPADVDPEDDQAVIVIREWTYAGAGYLDTAEAARALAAAVAARERNRRR
jgi:hypothetical protein